LILLKQLILQESGNNFQDDLIVIIYNLLIYN